MTNFTAQEMRDRILQSLRENSASFRQKRIDQGQVSTSDIGISAMLGIQAAKLNAILQTFVQSLRR